MSPKGEDQIKHPTYLAPSPEKVRQLGDTHVVGHMGLASTPVVAKVTESHPTYLTPSPEKVRQLGDAHVVGHMGLASGGSAPVDADAALLQNIVKPLLTQYFLK